MSFALFFFPALVFVHFFAACVPYQPVSMEHYRRVFDVSKNCLYNRLLKGYTALLNGLLAIRNFLHVLDISTNFLLDIIPESNISTDIVS